MLCPDLLTLLQQVAIVVGGGNIFRGSTWAGCSGLDRSSADYIGYCIMCFIFPQLSIIVFLFLLLQTKSCVWSHLVHLKI